MPGALFSQAALEVGEALVCLGVGYALVVACFLALLAAIPHAWGAATADLPDESPGRIGAPGRGKVAS